MLGDLLADVSQGLPTGLLVDATVAVVAVDVIGAGQDRGQFQAPRDRGGGTVVASGESRPVEHAAPLPDAGQQQLIGITLDDGDVVRVGQRRLDGVLDRGTVWLLHAEQGKAGGPVGTGESFANVHTASLGSNATQGLAFDPGPFQPPGSPPIVVGRLPTPPGPHER